MCQNGVDRYKAYVSLGKVCFNHNLRIKAVYYFLSKPVDATAARDGFRADFT